jgi:hypothetical protein
VASYDPNTTPLEMRIEDSRNHQRECAARGDEQGVRQAQQKIDATLDELHIQNDLKRYRA